MNKILILGGGFGGVRCALDCARKLKEEARVTVIDRNSYHSFTPALYEIASAYQPSDDPFALQLRKAVTIPYRDIFENKNIDFVQTEIGSVDLTASRVVFKDGMSLDFDYVVFALGSQMDDFGIAGVREYAYNFKTVDDAVALHSKLKSSFADAVQGKIPFPIKFLIVGGGFTGIELASELAVCARKLAVDYGLNRRSFSSVLFEAGPNILPALNPKERKKIIKRLTDLGVVIMTDSIVENVLSDSIKTKTGQVFNGTVVVWTAGVKSNQLVGRINGLPVNNRGRIIVEKSLRIPNTTNLFALGDCIEFVEDKTQKQIPDLAYVAQDQGRIVAENIIQTIRKKKLNWYIPNYDYWVIPVGGKSAIANLGWLGTFTGLWGWIIRLLVDLRYFCSILPLAKAIKLFKTDIILFSKND